jgi:hypothetical protein
MSDTFIGPDPSKLMRARTKRAAECAAKVREIQKAQPGLSFSEAWEIAKNQNPELFAGENEQASDPALAANELASRARAQALAQVVQAVQASHPDLSFEQSWQIARAKHADLFEGSTRSTASYRDFQDRCGALLEKMDAAIERTGSGL